MKKNPGLFLVILFFAGCNKGEDTAIVNLDITMANLAGTYKITAATVTGGGTTVDVFHNNTFFDDCDRDDIYVLTAAGAYTLTDAGITCTPANGDAGPYTIDATAKTITIGTETFMVVSLTSTKLVVAQPNYQGSGLTGTVTFTRQ